MLLVVIKVVYYSLSTFLAISSKYVNLVPTNKFWLEVKVLIPNYILVLSLTFCIFFLLGGKFYVDIWGMTIARHGEKLNRMN